MLGPDSTARSEQLAAIIDAAGLECTWAGNTFRAMVEREGVSLSLGPFSRGGGGSQCTLHAPRTAFEGGLPTQGEIIDLGTHKLRVVTPDNNPGSYLLEIQGTLTPA